MKINADGSVYTGRMGAAKRLAAKREANNLIPDGEVFTRQRKRQAQREESKGMGLSDRKSGMFRYRYPAPAVPADQGESNV